MIKNVPGFAAALGVGAICTAAASEVPAWHQEWLNSQRLIVSGVVIELSRRQFSRRECQLDVEKVFSIRVDGEGGKTSGPPYVISAHNNEWSCIDRPDPPGPTGVWLARRIKVGDHVKIYASPASQGEYIVGAPNGIQVIN